MRKGRIKKQLRLIFLFGVIVGIFVVLLIQVLSNTFIKKSAPEAKLNDLIAPYYESRVFKLPPDIKNLGASVSARIKIPIIMYHYVEYISDLKDIIKKRLDTNPYLFEQQLITLKENHYESYFVKDVPDILSGKIQYSTHSAVLTFDDGYEDFYFDVFPFLKRYQIKATVYIINDFIGKRGFLNEDEIKEIISSDLVEIGSHTLDHVYLKYIPQDVARKQIFDSKTDLEKRFNVEVKTFAYPYGAFSQETEDLVKEASFSAAVSVISGSLQSKNNLFYLSRIRPGFFSGTNIVNVIENLNH